MRITKIIFSILTIAAIGILFLQIIDILNYKNNVLGNIISFMVIFIIIVMLTILIIEDKHKKNILKMFISIFLIIILLFGILHSIINFIETPWKTQTIIAKNNKINNYFIESQMQDIGAFGYRNRVVTVYYIGKNIMIISKKMNKDQNIESVGNWERVDIEINELRFDSGF